MTYKNYNYQKMFIFDKNMNAFIAICVNLCKTMLFLNLHTNALVHLNYLINILKTLYYSNEFKHLFY